MKKNKGMFFLFFFIFSWLVGYFLLDKLSTLYFKFSYYELIYSRAMLIALLIFLVYNGIHKYEKILSKKGSSINLSIIRILYFGFIIIGIPFNLKTFKNYTLSFKDITSTQIEKLPITGFFWKHLPINEDIINVLIILFIITSLLSFLGLFSKYSIIFFSIVTLYLFGIPNFSGKINHNHDFIWIPAILAFGGCGDSLSIDSLIKNKFKNIKINMYGKKYNHTIIALWLMLGICYFFPGFWKIWNTGLDWALSDNIKNQLYFKWNTLSNWQPIFQLDKLPILYKLSGLFTLIFELGFIFAFPQKKLKLVFITSGLIFHVGTGIFMNIFFISFFILLLGLFEWDKILIRKTKTSEYVHEINPKLFYIISLMLIIGFSIFGILRIDSWPFSCYPRFDNIASPYTQSVDAKICSVNNECRWLSKNKVREKFRPERIAYWENEITKMENVNIKTMQALDQLHNCYIQTELFNRNDSIIKYYKITQWFHPDSSIHQEFIGERMLKYH